MVYRAIGVMSGTALGGLDIVFAELQEAAGSWKYTIGAADRYPYSSDWKEKIRKATSLSSVDYLSLHTAYGHYIGKEVRRFIAEHALDYQVQLVVSHGHASFHLPEQRLTAQLGAGSAIAAETGINVVSDLRAMDMALGGNGAPIVPMGEKLLFGEYQCFLNIGSIVNIACHTPEEVISFDICPANKVLNMLAAQAGETYDPGGKMAATGEVKQPLLQILNELEYYSMPYPKYLSIDFATDVIFPLLKGHNTNDAMRTYVEHVAVQTVNALVQLYPEAATGTLRPKLLVTGGGANNTFLVNRILGLAEAMQIEVIIPDQNIINFKEALVMALIGILRWREENNVLAAITGAERDSIGGAVWIGQEA